MSEETSQELVGRQAADFYKDHLWLGEVVGRLLREQQEDFRFLKLVRNEDGSWFAIVGAYDPTDRPLVCLSYSDSLRGCIGKLEKRTLSTHWQEDKYADGSRGTETGLSLF